MIVKSVELEDFKRHETLFVEFTEGTNLIVGNNYAGKSTIIQAVMLGLLGNAAVPGQTSDLVRTGATNFTVVLELSNGDKIFRTAKNSTVKDKDGSVTARTHTAVNSYVAKLLGVDRKTFMKVFCSEQGSPQALLSMEGAELQRFIEVCLGVDGMDSVLKQSSMEARLLQAQVTSKQEFLMSPAVLSTALEDIKVLTEAGLKFVDGISTTKEHIKKADKTIAELSGVCSSQEVINRQVETYLQHKKILDEQIASLPPVRRAEDASLYEEEIVLLEKDLASRKEVKAKQANLMALLDKCVTRKEQGEAVVAAFKSEYPEEVSMTGELEEQALCHKAYHDVESEIKSVQKQISTGVCQECLRAYDDEDEVIRLKGVLEELLSRRNELSTAFEKAREVAELQSSKRQVYLKAAQESGFAEADIRSCVKTEDDLTKQLHDLPLIAAEPSEEVLAGKLSKLKSCERQAVKQAAEVKAELKYRNQLDLELNELVVPSGEFKDLAGTYDKLKTEDSLLNSLREDLSSFRVSLEGVTNNLNFETEKVDKHNELESEVASLITRLRDYLAISDVVSSSRSKIIDNGFSQILSIASEFVATCTGGDISEVSLGESGLRYQEGEHSRGTVCASGAQKSLIGVGLKLGVAQVVSSPFACMLLDEVSADMDEDISLACLTVLGDYNQQAIVVSHRAMDVADNVIEVG